MHLHGYSQVVTPVTHHQIDVELDWLAPLMGLSEELGEYADAREKNDLELQLDSIADMGIYFCDYWHRFYGGPNQVCLDTIVGTRRFFAPSTQTLAAKLGRLYQVHLKRFQGIRGMKDDLAFAVAVLEAQQEFFGAVDSLCETLLKNFYDLTKGVFDEQVAKRNWKLNNKDGSNAASNA